MRSPSRRGQGFVTCVGNAIKKTPVVGVGGMSQRLRGMGRGFVEWVEALWNVSGTQLKKLWSWGFVESVKGFVEWVGAL